MAVRRIADLITDPENGGITYLIVEGKNDYSRFVTFASFHKYEMKTLSDIRT